MLFTDYAERMKFKTSESYLNYYNEMENLFDRFYLRPDNLSQGQKKALKEILENVRLINETLQPLKNIGMNYSLSLVGGAVRDLVLDKTELINDYDFVIELPSFEQFVKDNNVVLPITNEEQDYLDKLVTTTANFDPFTNRNLIDTHTRDKQEGELKLKKFKFVEKYLNLAKKPFQSFKNNEVAKNYLNKRIDGIFQFTGTNNKKIDLIISEYGALPFITSFDFEICKGLMEFKGLSSPDRCQNKSDIECCLDGITLLPGMLRDLGNKTLSIAGDNFNVEHIHYFMNKHFIKLREKFPEYKLNPFQKRKELDKTDVMATLYHYKLNDELTVRAQPGTRKLKI